ncbi:MAG: AMP-binding protein [Candidatus Hydrogenedentota bacterium]|nr:MAG: AMP-binding protein [Candidatus Hydrogenedentota bacterium]
MLLGDLLCRNRKLFPDRTAFVFEGKRFTYTEADERANRLANALIRLGVKREGHVAILSKNCNEYLETYFACARSGSICTTINYRLTLHELHYVLENSAANVVIVSVEFTGSLPRNLSGKVLKKVLREHYWKDQERQVH